MEHPVEAVPAQILNSFEHLMSRRVHAPKKLLPLIRESHCTYVPLYLYA